MGMPLGELVRVCLRRWYVCLTLLALTAATVAFVHAAPGVYWARTKVVLLEPPASIRTNKLMNGSAGLIATAGVVASEMSTDRLQYLAINPNMTIVDQGIFDGELVSVPNRGGQWAANFTDPVLVLQASGPSQAIVEARIDQMIAEAKSVLSRLQDRAGVSGVNRITFTLSPRSTEVSYARGDRRTGALVAGALGVALSVLSAAWVDRALARRRRLAPTG